MLNDGESSEGAVRRACHGLRQCGTTQREEMWTHDSTAAARLGAIRSIIAALRRASSPDMVGYLFCALYSLMLGNSKVRSIVEDHTSELIPLVKEYAHSLERHRTFLSLCTVLTVLAGKKTAAPQLCSVCPIMTRMMQKPAVSDYETLVATCVLANFARTAMALRDRRLWKYLDSNIDARCLTDLAISSVSGKRKGEVEVVLLVMYGHVAEHPSIRRLIEHNVTSKFILPYLKHASARQLWPERDLWCYDDYWVLFRHIAGQAILARCLVQEGVIDLAVQLVARQVTKADADLLDVIWHGKASALAGLAALAGHRKLRRAVAAGAGRLPLEQLARHEDAPLREAAKCLAMALKGGEEGVAEGLRLLAREACLRVCMAPCLTACGGRGSSAGKG